MPPDQIETTEAQQETSLHEEKRTSRTDRPPLLYAPISRIDLALREVECVATSEAVDSFGTIFSYEGSKRAFQRWINRTANVREMHERKAVAKGVGVFFDDEHKQVILRSRVSRGAPDTWTKITEGILTGYSVGATHPVWGKVERGGKTYDYLQDYELTEVSLVDNPSNPDAYGLIICRIDGLSDLIEQTDPEPEPLIPSSASSREESIERVGARISTETRTALHTAIDSALTSAISMMTTCGCEGCSGKMERMAAEEQTTSQPDTNYMADHIAERVLHLLSAPMTRMQAIAGSLARSHQTVDLTPLTTLLTGIETRLATLPDKSSFDEVCLAVAGIKDQVDTIAEQPQAGGPVLNAAALTAIEKRFASDGRGNDLPTKQQQQALIEHLHKHGAFRNLDDQIAAAALFLQPSSMGNT